jgi:Cu(I)/Ag(I) efflux system membrane fusion protein
MKKLIFPLLLAAAAAAGWFLRGYIGGPLHPTDSGDASQSRKVLYYQSAMHPWIKSDRPGRCTICGMELTPIYEGETGFDETAGSVVALTPSQVRVLNVQTAEVKKQPLARTLQVAGMIDDDATRHRILSAWVDGRIEKLYVNFTGAEVAEGEPLADIYSPPLLQAERDYRQLSGELKKNTALRLRQMGLTPAQIAALDRKPDDVLTSQILSPVGGTVVSQNVFAGEYVRAGAKLFEIADFATMWFQFRAYEQDLPWIEPGQCVIVTTPSLPGKKFEGKVAFIDPNFDDATRSTKVRVELPNPLVNGRRELLHRLYADGTVTVAAPEVLAVPRSAVIETGREAVVYVDKSGGAYERTVVTTGRRGDALVEILAGLEEGDKVVVQGNLLLDGQAEMNRAFMRPVEAPAAAPDTLTEAQRKAIGEFVRTADVMAAALAADDLAAFHKASGPAMEHTGALIEALRGRAHSEQLLDALEKARHFHGFDDLKSARIAFHRFTLAATPVLEPLRAATGVPDFQVFECAMVDQAIPGAPPKGRWLQAGGRAGHNPFFGREMLDCAQEIKRAGHTP